jgi:hypothetical protein
MVNKGVLLILEWIASARTRFQNRQMQEDRILRIIEFSKKIIYPNFCDKKLMLTNNNYTVTTMRVQELEK